MFFSGGADEFLFTDYKYVLRSINMLIMILLHAAVGLKVHFGSLTKTLASTTYQNKNFTFSPNCRDLTACGKDNSLEKNGRSTENVFLTSTVRVQ